MGLTKKFIVLLIVVLTIFITVKVKLLFKTPIKPNVEETWWKLKKLKNDTSIRPFKIHVTYTVINDLMVRLNKSLALQKSLYGVKQHYGMNDKLLETITDFWMTKYNWTKQENYLNQYPQFKTNIQGLDIHFIRVKPTHKRGVNVIPLLLLHGWPGSVREFYEIIPILTAPTEGRKFIFEVIIPSLPGYGFSEAPEVPGLSTPQMAVLFKNLMNRLGVEKFYVHGTDWGAFIISQMAALFPENILGMHSPICWLNTPWLYSKLALYSLYPSLIVEEEHQDLIYPMLSRLKFLVEESGYLHIQTTKPDTVGVALRDSPVGLAAYILEKFSTWTNPSWKDLEDGGLTRKFRLEKIIDNIMIYWVSGCITTSMRLYKEYIKQIFLSLEIDSLPIDIPSGCSRFKHELIWLPEKLLKERYKNLIHLSIHSDGGHFAAFEMPQIVAEDIIKFTEKAEVKKV